MELKKLGPFQIGRVLGRGGMGAVYEGTYDEDGSTVAVKVLSDALDDEEDAEIRLRFETEIETLKRLHHPNIVRLSGFGEDQGKLYYVMEFVGGSSLQQELRKKRLFQWIEVAKIGLDICQALRHAHDRGVIHRDIKPANILLNQEGNVKLSDFGIARFFGSQQITDVHSVIGTLEYMSPEQALALPISSSADLYSLGCVLYALLTGKPPFTARSLPEMLRKHKGITPDPVHSVRHDVPDDLGYLIVDLLQIQPENRPRNALLAAKRLQSLLQALAGPPDGIKVLPMSPDTPKRLHESTSAPTDDYRSPVPIPPVQDDVVNLGEVVKPAMPTPQQESLADSFKRIGEEHATVDFPNVATSSAGSENEVLQNDTTSSSSSIWENSSPIASQHDNVPLPNTQTLYPAKDALLSDTAHSSETPLVQVNDSSAKENDALSGNLPNTPVKSLKAPTRFTAVETNHFDPYEEENRTARPVLSLPMVLTSTMLMIIGLTVYYLIQNPSAEVLYKRITVTIKENESSSGYSLALLRSAQNDIDQFLSLYSSHPSAEQIRYYQDELNLLEHERRLERRAQFLSSSSLSPVERAYVEILSSSPTDSEQMIDKLQAFIAVFQPVESSSEESAELHHSASNPVDICVELAQRRLKKLEQAVDEINAEQEQVIRRRLDEAVLLDSSAPQRADGIRRGIVELYQNHRWAKKLVEEAKQQLKEQ